VILGVAVGTVVFFLEHRGEASCPKCGKPCAGDDAVGEARFALHRARRGGRDRPAERSGGVDERADPADQAVGVGYRNRERFGNAIPFRLRRLDLHPRPVSTHTSA
jgi:hypothetical protein